MIMPLISRALLLSALIVVTHSLHAVTLTVTPNSVAPDSTADLQLQIGGVGTGEKVTLERIVDANSNGVADRGETVVQAFSLTDNQAATIGGIRNLSVPGDEDAANGAIRTKLNFGAGSEVLRSSGSFIFRVTGPSGAVLAPFTVTQPPFSQTVSGTVRSSGTPVAGAVVALIEPGEDGDFISGAISDANGNYTLKAPTGTFAVLPIKPGYFSNFAQAVPVSLAVNQSVTADLALELATGATVSGRFYDRANTTIGLSMGQLFISNDPGKITLAFVSLDGSYSIKLPPGEWFLEPRESAGGFVGYIGPDEVVVTVGTSDVTLDVPMDKGTALVYGNVKNKINNSPLAGIGIGLNNFSSGNDLEVEGFTDANGNYAVAVTPGQWSVHPSRDLPSAQGWVFSSGQSVMLVAGETEEVDFQALPSAATIIGFVKNESGQGLPFIDVYAYTDIDGVSYNTDTETDEQGNFVLQVVNGSWNVGVDSFDLTELGYQALQNQNIPVSGSATANFIARQPSSHIRGKVVDDQGTPLTFIRVIAFKSGGGFAQAETDGNGNYGIGVEGGNWTVQLESSQASERGYIAPQIDVQVPSQGEVNNVNIVAQRALRRIIGTLKTGDGTPIGGINIYGSTELNGNSYNSFNQTTAEGTFELPVFSGRWFVSVDSFTLQQRGFNPPDTQTVTVADTDVTINLVATAASARLRGRVIDEQGSPISFLPVYAFRNQGGFFQGETDFNGNFDIGLEGDQYSVQVSTEGIASRGLIGPSVSVTVPENGELNGVVLIARNTPRRITGTVKNTAGQMIPDVTVFASLLINNTNYYTQIRTDGTGSYSLRVFPGTWALNLSGGDLQQLGYQQHETLFSTVNTTDTVVHFTVKSAGGNPELTRITLLSGGDIQITGTDPVNRTRHLEATTDFNQWTVLQTYPSTVNSFEFTDTLAPTRLMRFYRIRTE